MHLIGALVSGIRGAELGTAELYRRGTSAAATWYTDFEASSQSATVITLDSHGGAEVYVNELVDVICKSSDGVIVRSFTDGVASPNVEVISPSFTGADYVTGAIAPGKPTTAQSVFDRWITSAGATDFNVLLRGSAVSIEDAIGAMDLGFFNVKGSIYGATGDGVTDDSSAIQDALDSAALEGGIVILPPGTYRIVTGLELSQNVILMGAGAGSTTILLDHPTESAVYLVSELLRHSGIHRIRFTNNQAGTGVFVDPGLDAAAWTVISDCAFVPLFSSGDLVGNSGDDPGYLTIERCLFAPADGVASSIRTFLGNVRISDCEFLQPSVAMNSMIVRNDAAGPFSLARCNFDLSAVPSTVPVAACVFLTASGPTGIFDCTFEPGGGTPHAFFIDANMAGSGFSESGNIIPEGFGFTLTSGLATTSPATFELGSIDKRIRYNDLGGAGVHTLSAFHGVQVVRNTANTNLSAPASGIPGQKISVTWHNDAGAGSTITWAGTVRGDSFGLINANCYAYGELEYVRVNGTAYWTFHRFGTNLAE